jgi:hypothetical protein
LARCLFYYVCHEEAGDPSQRRTSCDAGVSRLNSPEFVFVE